MALPPALLTSARGHAKNDSWAAVLGGGVSHPLQLTIGPVIKSVTTSPTFGRWAYASYSLVSIRKNEFWLKQNTIFTLVFSCLLCCLWAGKVAASEFLTSRVAVWWPSSCLTGFLPSSRVSHDRHGTFAIVLILTLRAWLYSLCEAGSLCGHVCMQPHQEPSLPDPMSWKEYTFQHPYDNLEHIYRYLSHQIGAQQGLFLWISGWPW